MNSKIFRFFPFLFIILISCQHESEVDFIVDKDVDCDPNKVYFVNDIRPILLSSCAYSGCHDAISHREGFDFSTYAGLMASGTIKAGNAEKSELYEVLSETGNDQMPPPPKASLSDSQKQLIKLWIEQGAQNNECLGCDSSNVGFSSKVWPILKSNCQGCHSGGAPSGGISITNYSEVNTLVQNGYLIGTITAQSGFSPMPKNSSLTACDISIIKKWINNGAQND